MLLQSTINVCFRICARYEEMTAKVSNIPMATKELVEVHNYLQEVRSVSPLAADHCFCLSAFRTSEASMASLAREYCFVCLLSLLVRPAWPFSLVITVLFVCFPF